MRSSRWCLAGSCPGISLGSQPMLTLVRWSRCASPVRAVDQRARVLLLLAPLPGAPGCRSAVGACPFVVVLLAVPLVGVARSCLPLEGGSHFALSWVRGVPLFGAGVGMRSFRMGLGICGLSCWLVVWTSCRSDSGLRSGVCFRGSRCDFRRAARRVTRWGGGRGPVDLLAGEGVLVQIAEGNFGCRPLFNRPAYDSPRRRHRRAEVLMPVVDRSPTARRRRSQEGRFRLR